MISLGNAVQDKDSQLDYLKTRLNMFDDVLDSIEPEHIELADIDRLIEMIDDIETKCDQFNKN